MLRDFSGPVCAAAKDAAAIIISHKQRKKRFVIDKILS
jgi:hypothetical protein